jgi:hypothetical protein
VGIWPCIQQPLDDCRKDQQLEEACLNTIYVAVCYLKRALSWQWQATGSVDVHMMEPVRMLYRSVLAMLVVTPASCCLPAADSQCFCIAQHKKCAKALHQAPGLQQASVELDFK